MPATLVIQSHRDPLPFGWMQHCLDSVENWAQQQGYDYRFIGDELFTPVSRLILEKTSSQKVITSDLARLKWLQQELAGVYDYVVWCDADFLIFRPQQFILPQSDYALGREVWVQQDNRGRLRAYKKIHNAFMMFRRGNSFLDFYTDSAERLLTLNQGSMSPQFIGPKLLTALHNLVICPVMENAGMLSPRVIRDLLAGHGEALDLFRRESPMLLAGTNLSSSLTEAEGFTKSNMEMLIQHLLESGV